MIIRKGLIVKNNAGISFKVIKVEKIFFKQYTLKPLPNQNTPINEIQCDDWNFKYGEFKK